MRRADGSLASTPVWVVGDGEDRLLVWTGAETRKARRIRRDGRVLVAASDYRGRERGPRIAALARILDPQARSLVAPLLRRKYGWQWRLLGLRGRLARSESTSACIEIVLAAVDGGSADPIVVDDAVVNAGRSWTAT